MPGKKRNRPHLSHSGSASGEPDLYASYNSLNLIKFNATPDLVRIYLWQTFTYDPDSYYAKAFRQLGSIIELIDLAELSCSLDEKYICLPREFYAFSNKELLHLLNEIKADSWHFKSEDPILRVLPYFFTSCNGISYEQGGLVNLEHYCCGNYLAAYTFSGKRVSPYCHDLSLCINGTFGYRSLHFNEEGFARYRPGMNFAESYDKLRRYPGSPYTLSVLHNRDKPPYEIKKMITPEEEELQLQKYDPEFAWKVIFKLEKNYKEKIWYTAPWFRKYFRDNIDFALWAVSGDYQAFPLLSPKLMRNKTLFNLFALSAPYDLVALTILEYDLDDSCLRSPVFITNWIMKSKFWELSEFMQKNGLSTDLMKIAFFRNDFQLYASDFPQNKISKLSHLLKLKGEMGKDDIDDLPF